MTYLQYTNIISGINQKINWDIHLSALPLSGEIKDELNPLYSETEPEEKVFRLSDAMQLQSLANKG